MINKYLMENLTWKEFESKKDNILILPVGSTEQHGPHLPLSVDSTIAKEISLKFAQKVDGIVAPTFTYGYKSKPLSGGGPLFPGTIDLNGDTLIKLTYDVLEEFIEDGITKIFVINAHFENEAFLIEAIDLISQKYPNVTIVESNWWDVLPDNIIDELFTKDGLEFPGWALEHAAVTETSLMMYLAPNTVREDLIIEEHTNPLPYYKYPIVKGMVPDTGALANAKGSTAEKGKLIVDISIDKFIQIVNDVF